MTPTEKQEKEAIVRRAVDTLREHFDTVLIMVVCNDDGHSFSLKKGSGDVYSRIGLVREYLLEDDQRTRAFINRECNPPPPDGPESWQWL